MKILLITLLLALPVYSQFNSTESTPCSDNQVQIGRDVVKSIKRFKPAYNKAEITCTGDDVVLALELSRGPDPQRVVSVVQDHLKPRIASFGLARLVVEGRYWDPNLIGTSYHVAPVTVITTRTSSTSVSTASGGEITERNRYEHRRKVIVAVVESDKRKML